MICALGDLRGAELGPGAGAGLFRTVGEGAGVHGQQRDAVREHVVHLTGDGRVGAAGVGQASRVVGAFACGVLAQLEDQQPAGAQGAAQAKKTR